MVQGNEVLREIREVQRLIFWTGFNGTRVFTGSALVPEDEIFGGGNKPHMANSMDGPAARRELRDTYVLIRM